MLLPECWKKVVFSISGWINIRKQIDASSVTDFNRWWLPPSCRAWRIPSKSNLNTTSPNSVSNLFESKHLYFASENGTTSAVPVRASLLRGVVYFQTERNTFAWLGLNAYQIVNKLRSSVASCMFQTCKHITPWHDQSLYPMAYPNTCQNHASENTIFYAREAGRQ